MPSWKKILQSGSAVHVLNITASSLPNSSQPNIIGYDTASGRFTYFSTSSLVSGGGSVIGGSGTENYITRWSSGTTITTSSIYESSSRIGIGTTSPQGPLHIRAVSNGSVTPGIFLDSSNGFDPNEPFDIRLASVGVGAPQARAIRIIASSSLDGIPGGAAISVYNITSSNYPGWVFIDSGAHNDAKILFRTAQTTSSITERMVISSSGNIGIGTSSPTERLHVDGNLLVTGRITAEEFHTEFVSASIIYQSGSTQFGNSLDDTHIFTGSLRVNGSITGSLFGTASWATNAQTASLALTASSFSGQNFATFTQSAASTTWTFNHNLNFRTPVITVYDNSYQVIIPDSIQGTSDNQSVITFSTAKAGYASATVGSILPNNALSLMLAYSIVL